MRSDKATQGVAGDSGAMTTDLTPAHPRCEYLTNPLGIDIARPRLSWTLDATRRGRRQSAYHILVASRAALIPAGRPDLWDSGKVASARSAHIAYGGPALGSGQRCWWAVRVWDEDDDVSASSALAWWEMGLLHADDWRGAWIGLDGDAHDDGALGGDGGEPDAPGDGLAPSPYLRATFTVARPVARARLYATACGLYEARLNGRRVGDAHLTPGWTDYDKRIQYQTCDVTDLLRAGENVVGAILGTGWYSGHVGFGQQRGHYGTRPQLLLQLRIEYDDGTSATIVSDSSWRGAAGPILSSDLLMGETYDARRELAGWDAPGYDDARWGLVSVVGRDGTRLVADRAVPVRVTQELAAQSIARVDADTQIVDLGQNIAGWARLRICGAGGTCVRLRFAEMLDTDGRLYTDNLRDARATDVYVLRGKDEEVFEPHFTFHGFRYVEVTGYPGDLAPDAVAGRVVESDAPPAGLFECSDELVNTLQRNIVWGQRGNFLSIPTDCPQRDERLGWLGDAQIFARTACANRDVAAFFTKWLADVADAQSPAGAYPDIAPLLALRGIDLSRGAPAWGDAGVIVPWTLYQVYGDTRILEEHYAGMARWLAYIGAANPDHLWRAGRGNDFGDWLALDGDDPANAFGSTTPKDLLATAYYAHDARLLARMARILGRTEDAGRYEALFRAIKAAFVAAYVSPDGGVAGETQTGYVLALHMDLLPDALRTAAAERLVALIAGKGWHLTTGFVGVGYLLPVLTEAGYADVAYRLLLNETYPSWGYSIKHGATTIWERWDGWTADKGFEDPGMNSFNHYSLGSVGEWFHRYVAGIDTDPDRPGFAHIVIRPHPGGGLTHARATYDSIRGRIESAWRIDGNAFTLGVTIPANTSATVYVPTREGGEVIEGDAPARLADGVTALAIEGGHTVLTVQSGTYEFRSAVGDDDRAE